MCMETLLSLSPAAAWVVSPPWGRGHPSRRTNSAPSYTTSGRQDRLRLVVSVVQVDALAHMLAASFGGHHFTENLQAVAVGVEKVDAVGHAMVCGVVDFRPMFDEPAVQLAELRFAA